MKTIRSIAPLRQFVRSARRQGQSVAFVPTMGALHAGHRACVEIARRSADVVVISIFVNPTQFGPGEDFTAYPRPAEADLRACREWGCDVAFVPTPEAMYPAPQDVWVEAKRLSRPMCGRTRKGHFRGVATVVAKLFHAVEPDVAVFGQKDAQQALIIRETVQQLNMPVEILLAATARERDGLAMSSRNAYLSASDRRRAAAIFAALGAGRARVAAGELDPGRVCDAVKQTLRRAGIRRIEYVELRRADDLRSLRRVGGRMLLAVAVRIGPTRLIDNLVFRRAPDGLVHDELLF
jgi:pantoate--beta-alanine ligase